MELFEIAGNIVIKVIALICIAAVIGIPIYLFGFAHGREEERGDTSIQDSEDS